MASNCQRSKLTSIKKACDSGGNASGIVTELFIIPKEQVVSIPAVDEATGIIATDMVLETDTRTAAEITALDPADPIPAVFSQIDLSEIELSYTAEEEGEAEDGNIRHTLTGFLAKMTPGKNVILEALRGGTETITQFTDRNRYPWLMGDTDEGVKWVITPTTSPRNGYNIRGTYLGAKLLPSYTGAIALSV